MPASLPWLALLALAPQATAGSASGLGLPGVGGGLTAPGQDGATGLLLNPAAAHPAEAQVLLDAGMIRYNYGFQLQGRDPVASSSQDVLPYVAAAIPLGPIGIGLTGAIPYARSGRSEAVGPQRFHTVMGRILLFEGDLSLAAQVHPRLTLGAGLLVGHARYRSSVRIDTGAMVNSLVEEELAPVGDPFLEGTRTVPLATGNAVGFSAALRAEPATGWVVTAGYRSSLQTVVEGDLQLQPSNDVQMVLEGALTGRFTFPPEAFLAVVAPVGPVSVEVDGGWIGWGATAVSQLRVDDLQLTSEDPFFDALLESYGLSDPSQLGTLETVGMYGLHDIFTGAVSGRVDLGTDWGALLGFWYAPAAISEEWVAPGNFDYASLDSRLVLSWRGVPRTTLALAGDWIAYQDRHVTDSVYRWTNDPEVAPTAPSVNGDYWFRMFRVGLTAVVRL